MAFKEQISYQLFPASGPIGTIYTISDFYYTETKYIKATVYAADGQTFVKDNGTDFEVVGRSVEQKTAWEAGEVLIFRENVYSQETGYRNAEIGFDREQLETTLDYVTMLSQQNRDIFVKSIRTPLFDTATSLELPTVDNRVGRFITFDAQGNLEVRGLNTADIGATSIEWNVTYTGYTTNWIASYLGSLWVAVAPVAGTAPGLVAGQWKLYTDKTSATVATTTTVSAGYRDHTLFANAATAGFTVTLDDGEFDSDKVTVSVYGGNEVTITGTGLLEYQTDRSRAYIWNSIAGWLPQGEPWADLSAWEETAEYPTYGEKLISGELLLDGTNSLVSSDGREPVADTLDYIPAVGNVDGVEYTPAELKWSQRGTYGFFGEYANLAQDYTIVNSAIVTEEGGWFRLEAGANGSHIGYLYSAISTVGYFQVELRRGNADYTDIVTVPGVSGIRTRWDTKLFTSLSSGVDAGSYFISDDLAVVRFHAASVSTTQLSIYASGGTTPSGEYSYFRNQMAVDLPYPVPHHPGSHQAAKLQYDFDWAASDEWTIEGWFYADNIAAFQAVIDTRVEPGNDGLIFLSDLAGVNWQLSGIAGGTGSNLTLTGVNNGAWNHFKLIYIPGTSFTAYINGGSAQQKITDIPSVGQIEKILNIGSDGNGWANLIGYISDFRILPIIDTSDTHYLSGLPYYDPKKTYGKEAMWSVDHRGIISGESQRSGRIIFDEEINGQWVTKWDTGRMEISKDADGAGIANPAPIVFSKPFTAIPMILTTSISTVSDNSNIGGRSRFGFDLYRFNSSGASQASSVSWQAIGRWK